MVYILNHWQHLSWVLVGACYHEWYTFQRAHSVIMFNNILRLLLKILCIYRAWESPFWSTRWVTRTWPFPAISNLHLACWHMTNFLHYWACLPAQLSLSCPHWVLSDLGSSCDHLPHVHYWTIDAGNEKRNRAVMLMVECKHEINQ